jgi:hypothetical protein
MADTNWRTRLEEAIKKIRLAPQSPASAGFFFAAPHESRHKSFSSSLADIQLDLSSLADILSLNTSPKLETRDMQHQPPEAMQARKLAIYAVGIPANVYLDGVKAIEADATKAIEDYASVFRCTPAVALLKIAASLSTDPEQRLIAAVAELLAWSDPDELDPCADEAHDAVDEYTTFQRGV